MLFDTGGNKDIYTNISDKRFNTKMVNYFVLSDYLK